jgi:hypothetical protein
MNHSSITNSIILNSFINERIILKNISREDTFYKYLTNNEKKGRRPKYLRYFTTKRTRKIIKKKKLTN